MIQWIIKFDLPKIEQNTSYIPHIVVLVIDNMSWYSKGCLWREIFLCKKCDCTRKGTKNANVNNKDYLIV
jgi:hypothetical protein